jgi:uncharacterized membrane protein
LKWRPLTRSWPEAASLALALALAACGDDDRPAPCRSSSLTYETFGEPFLINWCRGCHSRDLPSDMRQGAPESVNFNERRDVRQRLPRISYVVATAPTMPPAGGPTDQERGLLAEWIGCGAP